MSYDEARRRIQVAFETKAISLDLRSQGLNKLPPEIARLTGLQMLNLSNNGLTELPPEIARLTGLQTLNLSNTGLTELPPEIARLTGLQELNLSSNQLTELPPEIARLTGLQSFYLRNNELTELPPEIARLTGLQTLDLSNNGLTEFPPEITRLTGLRSLDLSINQLTELPPEIGRLTGLQTLDLSYNGLTELPPEIARLTGLQTLDLMSNQLTEFPPEIGRLTGLQTLDLSDNGLTELPPEIARLTGLQTLDLSHNGLTEFPPEISRLTGLQTLNLMINQLTELPPEIGRLTGLQTLDLSDNGLTELPPEIARLTGLQTLDLMSNQLTELPPEIGRLTDLRSLDLRNNDLKKLPIEISQLHDLYEFYIEDNPIFSPPPEIIEQGSAATLSYLRDLATDSSPIWASKLLVVGEGGVGKTSLLQSINGEDFDPQESTTRGVAIAPVSLEHPDEPGVRMDLNAWDFGGQEIYHATHQFFLTNRSLFLVVWNARHGYEQGKLRYWLQTIQALAPESPILLVAAWIDERNPDLPFAELQRQFPQIVGQCGVSNKTREGIPELKRKIAEIAAGLPLMGERWPTSWLKAADAVRESPERCMKPEKLYEWMESHGLTRPSARALSRWLHEMGEILHFGENEDLRDLAILKPQWVTEYISKVLESQTVAVDSGVFKRDEMEVLWKELDPVLHDYFLRLMERFDLSYRTLENRDISLVVELLPLDAPDYSERWDAEKSKPENREIAMKFQLSAIPAGVPTWFIARQHRFTTHTHWRSGVLFQYEKSGYHLGLLRASAYERYLELIVRGPSPENFFGILRDGLEVTLDRFPGLSIKRTIPCRCAGPDASPCGHEFDYEQLQKRLSIKPVIECPVSLKDVSVPELLFGIHIDANDAVMRRLDELRGELRSWHALTLDEIRSSSDKVIQEFYNNSELIQRGFTQLYYDIQRLEETQCPNVFALEGAIPSDWRGKLEAFAGGERMELQLYCQAPGCWHPAESGGRYVIDRPAEWLGQIAPYVKGLVTALKCVSPFVGPWLGYLQPEAFEKDLKRSVELMEKLVDKGLPDIEDEPSWSESEGLKRPAGRKRADGSELRALRRLLDEKDPAQNWGGLKRVVTPERHILWLCPYHASEYDD